MSEKEKGKRKKKTMDEKKLEGKCESHLNGAETGTHKKRREREKEGREKEEKGYLLK